MDQVIPVVSFVNTAPATSLSEGKDELMTAFVKTVKPYRRAMLGLAGNEFRESRVRQ